MPRKAKVQTVRPGKARDFVTLAEITHGTGTGKHQDKRWSNRRENNTKRWLKEGCKSDPPSAMLSSLRRWGGAAQAGDGATSGEEALFKVLART